MTEQPSSYTAVLCPQCGATLHESGDTLSCPYCHSRLVLRHAGRPAPPADQGPERLVVFSLPDPAVGTPPLTMRVPAGWGYQGGVEWLENPAQVARIHFRVGNPGGVEAWEMFPMDCFGWTSDPMLQRMIPRGGNFYGVEFQPPADALDVLDNILLPRYRSFEGIEVLDMSPDDEATRRAEQEVRSKGQPLGVQAFRSILRYTVAQTVVLEQFEGAVYYQRTTAPGPYGMVVNDHWFTLGVVAFRAPEDQFRPWGPIFREMVTSVQSNSRWQAFYQQRTGQLAQLSQMQQQRITQAALERGRQIAAEHEQLWQAGRERMNQIDQIFDAYQAKSARDDYMQDERVRTMRGTDQYHDPTREKDVELGYGHKQVWSNGSGEYILSDDVNYDPNVGGTGNWSQIDPTRNG